MSDGSPLSVAEVTHRVSQAIEADPVLSGCEVRGEISNFRRPSSGHLYFSLKDDKATLACVMWRSDAARLELDPQDGQEVLVVGRVGVYAPQGKYQFYCASMRSVGAGDLWARFEALKAKLAAEGLFDLDRKRPLPRFPRTVAVISSTTGAATQDMLTILGRRYPPARVALIGATVQGETAPASLIDALERAARLGADVILIGRGGGSIEDLWCFNDEALVRAVAQSPIPVISAVGHETDFTLCDFAADLRAPTPSAAAELAVPDRADLLRLLDGLGERLRAGLRARSERARLALESAVRSLPMAQPISLLDRPTQQADDAWLRLRQAAAARLEERGARLATASATLGALSPRATLARGYAVARRARDGGLVRSVRDAEPGEDVAICLTDGTLQTTVRGKEPPSEH